MTTYSSVALVYLSIGMTLVYLRRKGLGRRWKSPVRSYSIRTLRLYVFRIYFLILSSGYSASSTYLTENLHKNVSDALNAVAGEIIEVIATFSITMTSNCRTRKSIEVEEDGISDRNSLIPRTVINAEKMFRYCYHRKNRFYRCKITRGILSKDRCTIYRYHKISAA